nr:hypothetical protein [Fodinibius sp.]NIV11743.1 hypothetical protein [Fodinibius sp.]NIY25381.1 hypothetical protein [Fodinibius sp.]
MTVIRLAWLFIACSIISNDLYAAPTDVHSDSLSYEQKLEEGIDAFYRADWVEAKALFKELRQEKPDDSRAYFFESMIPFWKYYFGGRTKQTAEQFLSKSQEAIKVSKQKLNKDSSDTTMVLMLS